MKKVFIILNLFLLTAPAFAENYLLNGGQESQIRYQMTQKIEASPGIRKLILSYVSPVSFESPTYRQKISHLDFSFFPPPWDRKDTRDDRGNSIIQVTWENVSGQVTTAISLTALNSVNMGTLQTKAPFPLTTVPGELKVYLRATQQVPSNDPRFQAKARDLTGSASSEFDAVQKILTWVVDYMNYVLKPRQYDAAYSFRTGKGNCQNYSHLAAALMRAMGIPVRIVNGVTLNRGYDIRTGKNILTMKMAQGRHSWIEVWFPDMGWVPFDPQESELFVSNRFIRAEVGLDNNETKNDGLIQWTTRSRGARPGLEERIEAHFIRDKVDITGKKMNYGPRKLLLCPQVKANFAKIQVKPSPPVPEKIPRKELETLGYTEPYVFGNLEFPENLDFLSLRGPTQKRSDTTMEMRKNFLVETAEYVTTQGEQYAQTFILDKPMKLEKVGLALHKFDNRGQLWLELFEDQDGKPGKYLATSEIIRVREMKFTPGYSWTDFDFRKFSLILSPGPYWVALGFTDGPIINWFFTYGKPVGPQYGTRYKKIFDETWSRSLAFEFNYRVIGLASK